MAGIDLSSAEQGLRDWLAAGFHGAMDYMAKHGLKRARPAELLPGTVSVISLRMNYLAVDPASAIDMLGQPQQAYISRYALGRDYHKVLRNRLQALAERISAAVGPYGYRVFTDSAPVLEVEIASRTLQGWRGKHTLLLNRDEGSFFFLGDILTDLPLPPDVPQSGHCGNCSRCIEVCPTQAIVAPYRLDARRCISYLTIELHGAIPLEFRPLIGNRVYGCDDCHLFCWTTHKHLPLAIDLLHTWGFRYVCAMVWHKPGGFQPIGLPQYNCEFVLYARRGSPSFIDTKAFPCCFNAPRKEHSRKPDEFYDVIRRVTQGPRIDVFSRESREGFTTFGNEAGKFDGQ